MVADNTHGSHTDAEADHGLSLTAPPVEVQHTMQLALSH